MWLAVSWPTGLQSTTRSAVLQRNTPPPLQGKREGVFLWEALWIRSRWSKGASVWIYDLTNMRYAFPLIPHPPPLPALHVSPGFEA